MRSNSIANTERNGFSVTASSKHAPAPAIRRINPLFRFPYLPQKEDDLLLSSPAPVTRTYTQPIPVSYTHLDVYKRQVYTIVLFEKSPKEFQLCPENYLHHLILKADTGIEIDMPQKFVYITLDIFRKKQQNEGDGIHSKLEAWLTFFCRDEPEMILKLIRQYPEFKPLYADVYELCRNMEEIMQIFSKELLEMDRNTVKLMIDEMQEEIQNKEQTISAQARIIESQNNNVKSLMNRIAELEKELSQK